MRMSAGIQESFIVRNKPRWMLCSHNWLVCKLSGVWNVTQTICQFDRSFPVSGWHIVRCEAPGDHGWHHASWGTIRSQARQHLVNSAGINGEIIGQENDSLWWSILAGLPRQIKWKLPCLWNIVSEWVACYLCFVCCGWLVCFWWDFLVA